jgi:hypothetical protein
MLCFQLNMPNIGSWNGQWTGEKKNFYRIRKVPIKKQRDLNGRSFYYDFGGGWTASVLVEKIDGKEAAKRRRNTAGFCGYDWMIDEIINYNSIRPSQERNLANYT